MVGCSQAREIFLDAVVRDIDFMRTRSPHVFLGLSIPYAPDGETFLADEVKKAEAQTQGAGAPGGAPNIPNAGNPNPSATPGQPQTQTPGQPQKPGQPQIQTPGQPATDQPRRLVARHVIPVQQKNLSSIVSSNPVAVRGVEFFSYREFDSRRDEIIQLMAHATAAKSYIILEVLAANCSINFSSRRLHF